MTNFWGNGIAGYTYNAENFCSGCIIEAFSGIQENIGWEWSVEGVLDVIAAVMKIDRQDESTFDSSTFPKVILDGQRQTLTQKFCKCGNPF